MPLSLLRKHARTQDSGEIIVAAEDGLEVHVYLLKGRVAWATSSVASNTLTNYLISNCGVEKSALREVVEECRRTNARFGDTLIEWKVATPEQVRAALHAQISDALGTLAGVHSDRSIFLPRQLDYNMDLTFDVDEVAPAQPAQPTQPAAAQPAQAPARPAATRARPTPPPTPAKPRVSAPSMPRAPTLPIGSGAGSRTTPAHAGQAAGSRPPAVKPGAATPAPALPALIDPELKKKLVRSVESALPAAIWARVVAAASADPDAVPGDDELRLVARALTSHGATAVTLRSISGTILGHIATTAGDWAFCGFPSGANVVRANAVLSRTLQPSGELDAAASARPARSQPVVEDNTMASMLTPIRGLMRQTEEMLAGLVLRMNSPKYVGANQPRTALAELAEVAMACVENAPATLSPFFPADRDSSAGQRENVTISVETQDYWHFGSLLSGESELFLWLVLAPQTPRGAGRVLLKKLVRQLSDDETPSVTGLWPASLDGSFERPRPQHPAPAFEDSGRDRASAYDSGRHRASAFDDSGRHRASAFDDEPAPRRRSSAFDDVRHEEEEETSSVYSIAPSRKRGSDPRGGSGAFG